MGKGVKSKNSRISGGFAKEIIGMATLLFTTLSLLCLLTGDLIFYTVGTYVRGFFIGLFGYFSFPVIIGLIFLGLRLLLGRAILPKAVKRVIWLVVIFAVSVCLIVETALYFDPAIGFRANFLNSYGDGTKDFYASTILGGAAMLIINPIGMFTQKIGCYILSAILIVVTLILLFKGRILDLLDKKEQKKAKNDSAVKAAPAKKHSAEPEYSEPDTSDIEQQFYHRPVYMGGGKEFGIKTKRDYNKEGRPIDVFGGSFTLKNNRKQVNTEQTYSSQYRKDLSPDANYIMTPPPISLEQIGQPPIKATNPSQETKRGNYGVSEYDDGALGRSVYEISSKNQPKNYDDSPYDSSDYTPRGERRGLFDDVQGRTNYDRSKTGGANKYDSRTQDIITRVGGDRGMHAPDQLSREVDGLVEKDYSTTFREEPNLPNVDKAYNPARHTDKFDATKVAKNRGSETRKSGYGSKNDRFNSNSTDRFEENTNDRFNINQVEKSNVPDFNSDINSRTRESDTLTTRGFNADSTNSSTSQFSQETPSFGGERNLRDSRDNGDLRDTHDTRDASQTLHTRKSEFTPNSAERSVIDSSFSSQTRNTIDSFGEEKDLNDGYPTIEEMPLNYRYTRPSTDLLADIYIDQNSVMKERERLMDLAKIVETNFAKRGISVTLDNIVYGMTITRFEYTIPTETSVKSFTTNQGDIAVWLHAKGDIRILAPIPGTSKIGIEVPNSVRSTVGLKELICSPQYRKIKKDGIYIPCGKNVMAEPVFLNLTDMPHLLIAGATGKGKSVFLNAMILSLIYTYSPEDLRIVIVDPKQLEFVCFEGIPHLLFNRIITKAEEAAALLSYLVKEMEDRYALFARARVKKIANYNEVIDKRTTKKLPYIIVLIDEFADLMMKNVAAKKDMDLSITRLAQLARAAGISLVFATQRPTTDVIDGTIKNNFPARICFKTADYTNSQVVIGENGAEKLLGKGDLLYKIDGPTERAQGALVEDPEIERVVTFVNQNNKCYYDKNLLEYIDKMAKTYGQSQSGEKEGQMSMDLGEAGNPADMPIVYRRAVRLVIVLNTTSKSMLQTKLGIGYNKAARIIDWMEKQGYISCVLDNKQREIRLDRAGYEQVFGEPFEEDYTK